jgi:hypothetical protein
LCLDDLAGTIFRFERPDGHGIHFHQGRSGNLRFCYLVRPVLIHLPRKPEGTIDAALNVKQLNCAFDLQVLILHDKAAHATDRSHCHFPYRHHCWRL